jgi:hypothetical protein
LHIKTFSSFVCGKKNPPSPKNPISTDFVQDLLLFAISSQHMQKQPESWTKNEGMQGVQGN